MHTSKTRKRDRPPNSSVRTHSSGSKRFQPSAQSTAVRKPKGQPSLKEQREQSRKAWIAHEKKQNEGLPKEYQTRRAKDENFQKELNDLEKLIDNPQKIYNEAKMLSDDINRGTVRREKYPCLQLVDKNTADAAMLDATKLQREMDTNALCVFLEQKYKLRAEYLAQTSAEQNCQGGGNSDTTVPIPGSRPPSGTRD